MGIDAYLTTREKVQAHIVDNGEKFRTKMGEFVQDNSKNMIFTEDLKNMVHIVEKDSNDIDLTIRMIKKYGVGFIFVRCHSNVWLDFFSDLIHKTKKFDLETLFLDQL